MTRPIVVRHRKGHCKYNDSLLCGVPKQLCANCAGIPQNYGVGAVKTHYTNEERRDDYRRNRTWN